MAPLDDTEVFAAARKGLDGCATVPSTVRVHVEGRLVTLTGSVERYSQRADAEHTVRRVIGDRQLLNHIAVVPRAGTGDVEAPDEIC